MAKIKVKGMPELITVPEADARALIEGRRQKAFSPGDDIPLGSSIFKNSDIIAIMPDVPDYAQSAGAVFESRYAREAERTREIQRMEVKEKARVGSWGHFSLFFYAFNGRHPKDTPKARAEVYAAAEKYLASHPWRTVPSGDVWADMLKIKPGTKADAAPWRILNGIERAQAQLEQQKAEEITLEV